MVGEGGRIGRRFLEREHWTLLYQKTHRPSPQRLVTLELERTVRVHPGEEVSLYVHSELNNDTAIVYDNQRVLGGGQVCVLSPLSVLGDDAPSLQLCKPKEALNLHFWGASVGRQQLVHKNWHGPPLQRTICPLASLGILAATSRICRAHRLWDALVALESERNTPLLSKAI